jgi:membrane-bound serine protease (ClpP class)
MDPQLLAIALLLAGFLLIIAEFFIPSGGTIALMCVACFVGSFYYAYKAWYHESPLYWWGYVASFLVMVPGSIWGGLRILTHTRLGDRILLRAPDLADVTPYQNEAEQMSKYLGQRGKAMTLMSPAGMVLVNGERLHASSEGMLVEAGTEIVVANVTGTSIFVRPYEPDETQPPQPGTAAVESPAPDKRDNPLDPWDGDDAWPGDEKTA